jgi:ketosteroid isomerase-like protein
MRRDLITRELNEATAILGPVSDAQLQILRDLNVAFNAGGDDWQRFYDRRVILQMPPEWPEEPAYTGIDGLARTVGLWREGFDDYHWHEERLVDVGDDRVVGLYRQRGRIKEAGTPIEQLIGIVFWFRGTKIVRLDGYFSWDEALGAAGAG